MTKTTGTKTASEFSLTGDWIKDLGMNVITPTEKQKSITDSISDEIINNTTKINNSYKIVGGSDIVYDAGGNDTYNVNTASNAVLNAQAGIKRTTNITDDGKSDDKYTLNVGAAKAYIYDDGGADKYTVKADNGGLVQLNDALGEDSYTLSAKSGSKTEIYDDAGNDTYTVNSASGAHAEIVDDAGDDTYNVKTLNTSVRITDDAGNDTLNITGLGKNEKFSIIFDVANPKTPTIDISEDLQIVSNTNIAKADLSGYVSIEDYFTPGGKIENINVNKKAVDVNALVDAVKADVASWLSGTTYSSAFDAIQNGSQSDVEALIKIYTGVNADLSSLYS